MQVFIGGIGVFGAVAIIIFLSTLNMVDVIKVPIIALAIFIAVYCLARIQPKEPQSGKDTGK